jgi:hypothetical protein
LLLPEAFSRGASYFWHEQTKLTRIEDAAAFHGTQSRLEERGKRIADLTISAVSLLAFCGKALYRQALPAICNTPVFCVPVG